MTWLGTWRNQYGSEVVISGETDGVVEGVFRTAIDTSPFFGTDVPIKGVHAGGTISFASAVDAADGVVVSYTGQLDGERLETMWFLVAGELDWWRSVTTSHDTFVRVS